MQVLKGNRGGLILVTSGGGEENGQINESPKEVMQPRHELQDGVLR